MKMQCFSSTHFTFIVVLFIIVEKRKLENRICFIPKKFLYHIKYKNVAINVLDVWILYFLELTNSIFSLHNKYMFLHFIFVIFLHIICVIAPIFITLKLTFLHQRLVIFSGWVGLLHCWSCMYYGCSRGWFA